MTDDVPEVVLDTADSSPNTASEAGVGVVPQPAADAMLNRKQVADALQLAGYRCSYSTLAALAHQGAGPPYTRSRVERAPGSVGTPVATLYRWGDALAWASQRRSRGRPARGAAQPSIDPGQDYAQPEPGAPVASADLRRMFAAAVAPTEAAEAAHRADPSDPAKRSAYLAAAAQRDEALMRLAAMLRQPVTEPPAPVDDGDADLPDPELLKLLEG